MRVIDLHPEDLLDRHEAGTLTDAERTRLHTHARGCTACRFELAARRDFSELATLVPRSQLITEPGLEAPQGAPAPSPTAAAPSGRKQAKRRVALIALAAALAAGVSLAAAAVRVIARDRADGAAPGNSERRKTVAIGSPRAASQTENAAPAPGTEVEANARGANDTLVRLDDLPFAAAKGTASDMAAKGTGSDMAAKGTASDTAQAAGTERHAPPGATAAALFRAANVARRDGEGARAIALYRRLEAQHPSSEEARLSYATLGRLLLDRGDARSALDEFDAYLSRGGGPLGEEALVGRALSLQKIGGTSAEIAAWKEILRRFPKSVHARLARSRLSALGVE